MTQQKKYIFSLSLHFSNLLKALVDKRTRMRKHKVTFTEIKRKMNIKRSRTNLLILLFVMTIVQLSIHRWTFQNYFQKCHQNLEMGWVLSFFPKKNYYYRSYYSIMLNVRWYLRLDRDIIFSWLLFKINMKLFSSILVVKLLCNYDCTSIRMSATLKEKRDYLGP